MSRAEGFAAIPNWMIRDRSIPRRCLLVYASLSSRSGLGGIFPSQETIAEESGIGERTAREAIKDLVELGVVERVRRWDEKGHRLSDGYALHPNGLLADSAGREGPTGIPTGNSAPIVPLIEVTRGRDTREKKSRKPIPLPEDWKPSPEHRELAAERGVDVELEAESFRAHAEANDRRVVVWNAAFRQWLLHARGSAPAAGGVPRCSACRNVIDAFDVHAGFGMCGSCLAESARGGVSAKVEVRRG